MNVTLNDLLEMSSHISVKYNCFIDVNANVNSYQDNSIKSVNIYVYDNKHKFIGSTVLLDILNLSYDTVKLFIESFVEQFLYDTNESYNKNYVIYDMQETSKDYPLSNFYLCKITYNGNSYTNVQSAYEAQKESNPIKRIPFTTCDGYTALKISKPDIKPNNHIMYDLLMIKFSDDNLKKYLIDTGDKEILYFNSWHDTYWGICKCDKCNMTGNNILGKLLMKVRSELIEQEQKTS